MTDKEDDMDACGKDYLRQLQKVICGFRICVINDGTGRFSEFCYLLLLNLFSSDRSEENMSEVERVVKKVDALIEVEIRGT
jgi:hypothetical protein